jgi:glycosyltransferase involved in cell wall biosynthesis
MRILLLSQWFAPEPHFKGLPLAQEFQRRGHHVTVLTGFPNYPGGKLYSGYRVRFWQRENMDGIEVVRVPLYPSHSRSAVGRIFNYASFALAAAVLGPWLVPRVDVAYVYHPPATIGLPAQVFRWLRGIRCVYDVQDLWPDTLAATGMVRYKSALALAGWWSNFVYRNMDRLVAQSPGFQAKLIERGVEAERVSLVYNWSPDEGVQAAGGALPASEASALQGKFNVVFAGNMGLAQGLDSMIAAAPTVARAAPDVQFVLVGGGVEAESLRRAAAGAKNVLFLPRRGPGEMPSVYAAADVLLVHLRDDPLFTITIPSKTQTYLAMGKPILAAVRGDTASLVEQSGAGLSCAPGDPQALADAVVRMRSMTANDLARMGENGRLFYRMHLARAAGASALLALLDAERPSVPASCWRCV